MRFRYLRDPLFLLCVATYFVNRLVFKSLWQDGFVHAHLNDLICIPFWVPIMLFLQRQLGLRAGDASPTPSELIIPLLVWSWLFEILLPQMGVLGVADHLDILYYALGALGAGVFWQWWYQPRSEDVPASGLGGRPAGGQTSEVLKTSEV